MSVALCPAHTDGEVATTETEGDGLMNSGIDAVLVHELAPVPITEIGVGPETFVYVVPDEPSFQLYDTPPEAVRLIDVAFEHIVLLPAMVIVGKGKIEIEMVLMLVQLELPKAVKVTTLLVGTNVTLVPVPGPGCH